MLQLGYSEKSRAQQKALLHLIPLLSSTAASDPLQILLQESMETTPQLPQESLNQTFITISTDFTVFLLYSQTFNSTIGGTLVTNSPGNRSLILALPIYHSWFV